MNAAPDFLTSTVSDAAGSFAQHRAAIDRIGMARARAIRVALIGTCLARPHPERPEDANTRSGWRDQLGEETAALSRICDLLLGSDPSGEVPAQVCIWLAAFCRTRRTALVPFETMRDLSAAIADAARRDEGAALERALKAHETFTGRGFFDSVTAFCDDLCAHLDADRHREVAKAATAATAIAETLRRLEHIGKHVRLVSLNASVEAARVGDAGRGLGVIAVEFKTLAEEIQRLAITARADVAVMSHPSDTTSQGPQDLRR